MKITAQSLIRAQIGRKPELELTDADREGIQRRDDEQAARLARIAARRAAVES